jgi:hypothetical protein
MRRRGARVSSPERRRAPRAAVTWPAVLERSSGPRARGTVVNASVSGIKVETAAELRVGEIIRVRLSLPGEPADVSAAAQVVRTDAQGAALHFMDLAAVDAERIRRHLLPWDLRRRAPRAAVSVPVRLREDRSPPVKTRTLDLSEHAVRVALDAPPEPGDTVGLDLDLPDGEPPLAVRALVWEVGPRGVVLIFLRLGQADYQRLQDYVHGQAPR